MIHFDFSFDLYSFILAIISSLIATAILFLFLFKPRIKIEFDGIDINNFRIKVTNRSCFTQAINVKIEACVLINGNTFHLKTDLENFLAIPVKDNRTFKTISLHEAAAVYEQGYEGLIEKFLLGNCTLRIRVHAQHEWSNFGKVFEKKFKKGM